MVRLLNIATALLLVLKILGVISISWLMVFLPSIIAFGIWFLIFVVMIIIGIACNK